MTSTYVQKAIDVGLVAYASSDYVIKSLHDYGEKLRANRYGDNANEALARALLERDDPVINIVLAANATSIDVLASLFSKSKVVPIDHAQICYLKSLRLATLSNDVSQNLWTADFPKRVISEDELAHLLETGDEDEVYALFENKMVDPHLLEDLYGGTGIFQSIASERRRRIVMATTCNKRLTMEQKSEHGPDLSFMRIHRKLHELLATAPVDISWADTLHHLISSLNPFNLPPPDQSVLPILERWKMMDDDRDGYYTELKLKDEIRCLMGAMYGAHYDRKDKNYELVIDGSVMSEDVAVRCAFYGKGKLDESKMAAGYQRDGSAYVLAAMNNQAMLLTQKLRIIFEENHLKGDLRYRYRDCCKHLHANYPYFDPRPLSEWLTDAQREDRDTISNQESTVIEKLSAQLDEIKGKNGEIEKLIGRLKMSLIWGVLILSALILART